MAMLSTEELKGKTVLEAGGQVIGSLQEIIIDTATWMPAYLRLRLRKEVAKEIGVVGTVLHGAALDVPVEMVGAAGDAVLLSVPLARLRELTDSELASRQPQPSQS